MMLGGHVDVHGPCGRRVADCTCADGPGRSLAARVAALESLCADMAETLAKIDRAHADVIQEDGDG